MFGPERSPVVFLENFIGHIQLVGILAVKFQKDQQKDNSPKQPTDVRKGLVQLLKRTVYLNTTR